MLTAHRVPRLLILLVSAASLVAATLLTFVMPAAADHCPPVFNDEGDVIGYENCHEDPGEDPPGEDPGGGELQCEPPPQTTDPYGDFFWCDDQGRWCQGTIAVTEPPEDAPPKPDEDAEWIFYTCLPPDWTGPGDPNADQGFRWSDPAWDPPTLEERAISAYGELVAPPVSLEFDPNTLTYVGTDTTFWAEGPTDSTIEGSEALGLVAQAFNGRVMVDPGDGSGTLECGWAVDEASGQATGCIRTYEQSSVNGGSTDAAGRPAYGASMWLVFDVQFLLNGQVIDVPGLDDQYFTWDTEPVGGSVPVGEVQVIID